MALPIVCCSETETGLSSALPISNSARISHFHSKHSLPKWDSQQKIHERRHSRHPIYLPLKTKFLYHRDQNGTVLCGAESNNPNEAVKPENIAGKDLLKVLIIPFATSFVVFSLTLGARVAAASAFTLPNRRLMPFFANVSSITPSTETNNAENPENGIKNVQKPESGMASTIEENAIEEDCGSNSIDAESPQQQNEEMLAKQQSEEEAQGISSSSVVGQECDCTENKIGEHVEQEEESPSENQIGGTPEELKFPENEELKKVYEQWRSKSYALTVPLRIVALRGSVPPAWLKDFIQAQGRRLKFRVDFQGSLRSIISGLASDFKKGHLTPRSFIAADLVTVGDSWLAMAIREGLIEPIKNAEQQDWFIRLSDRWKAYLRRDHNGKINPSGEIWAAPYRWGSMVVAYRKDKFTKYNIPPIKDWEDLWRPELRGKISMVDDPREVVGAVLKCGGASYNSDFKSDIPGGRDVVNTLFLLLRKQVLLFDSVHYLKAFGSGDAWVAVGWSSDVLPAAKRMSNVSVVVPKSGTSLWADLWVIPATSSIVSDKVGGRIRGPSPVIHQWFDFCLQPARATPFHQDVFAGASPLFLSDNAADIKSEGDTLLNKSTNEMQTALVKKGKPEFDTNLVAGMPPPDILEKCEFLKPLSKKGRLSYEWLLSQEVKGELNWPSSLWQYLKGIQENFKSAPLRGVR